MARRSAACSKAFWADEQPDGCGGVMALVNGMASGGEFGEEGTKRSWRRCRIAGCLSESEIELNPLMIVRTLGLRHPGLIEPALETGN